MMESSFRWVNAMRALFVCGLYAVLNFSPLVAQEIKTPPHIHHEARELEKLNYFVGSWTLKAKIEPSPVSEGGEFQQSQTVEWMNGEHFLVSHTETKGLLGDTFGLVVTGFDPKEKRFSYHSFHSTGVAEHGNGTVNGKTWSWISEPPEMDVRLQRRATLTELSPEKYSFLLEITSDGKNWSTVMQGEAEKQR